MNQSSPTPTAHRRLLNVMAGELAAQCCKAQAAQGKSEAETELRTLLAMTKLFDDTTCAVFRQRFGVDPHQWDYCPKVKEPSFDEITRRFDALVDHVESLGNSDSRFTRVWMAALVRHSAFVLGSVDWLAGDSEPEALELESWSINAKASMVADFSHRLSPFGREHGTLGFVDTVEASINKAVAIVTMLSNHFAADNDEGRPSDDSVYYALQAVQHELLDVGVVVEAFHRNKIR